MLWPKIVKSLQGVYGKYERLNKLVTLLNLFSEKGSEGWTYRLDTYISNSTIVGKLRSSNDVIELY